MSADKLPAALQATEDDIQLLLAAQCHLGTKNCDKTMEPYVWKRRADGEWCSVLQSENGGGGEANMEREEFGTGTVEWEEWNEERIRTVQRPSLAEIGVTLGESSY